MGNPYVAAVQPAEQGNARAMVRLLPAGRVLAKTAQQACPTGVRISAQPTREGLLLVAHSSRDFTVEQADTVTAAVQAWLDRRFGPGQFTAAGYTAETLPA
jgi:hypothetical protein